AAEVRCAGPRPPQPERLLRPTRRLGQSLDLDAQHAAANDWHLVEFSPAPLDSPADPRVQVVPRLDGDGAVAKILRGQRVMWFGPRLSIRQREAQPVAPRATDRARWRHRRVEVKDPLRADAHEHVAANVLEAVTERDRVVASVEHEEGHLTICGQLRDEAGDLVDGAGGLEIGRA